MTEAEMDAEVDRIMGMPSPKPQWHSDFIDRCENPPPANEYLKEQFRRFGNKQ